MNIKIKNKNIAIAMILFLFLFIVLYNNNVITKNHYSKSNNFNYSTTKEAIEDLNNLKISEDEDVPYDRNGMYGGWKEISPGWSTRDEILKQSAKESTDNGKQITSGTWYIDYIGETVYYDSKENISTLLQIDHIIPVSYANRHGAYNWDDEKRTSFYNDYDNLVVSDRHSNLSKGDKSISEWIPENNDYVVEYCEHWIYIANKYDISITQADFNKMKDILS